MSRRSPTLEGFRVLFHLPSLGLAEIAWRWSVGAAILASAVFAVLQYLDSLPVTAGDIFLMRTRHPVLVSRAIAHVLAGSASRFLAAVLLLTMALTLAWTLVAAVGRAIVLNALSGYFFPERKVAVPVSPLIALNGLRAAVTVAAILGLFAAVLLAGLASPKADPSPGSSLLILLVLGMFLWLFWAMLNWLLSLAAVCAISQARTAFGAIVQAVELVRRNPGPIVAVSIWFTLAHGVAYVVASSAAALPLAFIGVLPGGVIAGGVILFSLVYFAIVDYLYVGRVAAYLFIAESRDFPEVPTRRIPADPASGMGIDPTELILSDLPLGGAPA